MKIVAKRTALEIPVLVDLLTRHLLQHAFASTLTYRLKSEVGSTKRPSQQANRDDANYAEPQDYLGRDLVFALAMTTKGETTVTATRAKTITKPNMIFLAFFGFSVGQRQGLPPRGRDDHHPQEGGNGRKVAPAVQAGDVRSALNRVCAD